MPTTFSPLRYPGGKTKFYNYVKKLLECNDLIGETYIEPFAGGSGLALKLLLNNDVKRIVINDFDPAIYSFWYSVIHYTDELCELIDSTEITMEEWHKQRKIYLNRNSSKLELGFATLFLNRTNVSGVLVGGVIGGKDQTGKYKLDARFNKSKIISKIKDIAYRREQIVLFNKDAKNLLRNNELRRFYKSFINFDPPYVKKGAQLYKNSFEENDHKELFKLISHCHRKWIVTYDICPLIGELYSKYRKSYLDVTYSINVSKQAQEYIFFSRNLKLPSQIKLY